MKNKKLTKKEEKETIFKNLLQEYIQELKIEGIRTDGKIYLGNFLSNNSVLKSVKIPKNIQDLFEKKIEICVFTETLAFYFDHNGSEYATDTQRTIVFDWIQKNMPFLTYLYQ